MLHFFSLTFQDTIVWDSIFFAYVISQKQSRIKDTEQCLSCQNKSARQKSKNHLDPAKKVKIDKT